MCRFYQQIFSVTNKDEHKVLRIFGLKFKFKNKQSLLQTKIDKLNDKMLILEEIKEKIILLTNIFESFSNKTISKTNELLQTLQDNRFYNDPFEKNWIKKFLNEYNKLDKIYAYQTLIKNLDEDSIKLIARILTRIQRVNNGEFINLLYDDEIEIIKDLYANYYPNIIELSEDCFVYKHYFLPINSFEVPIFYNNLWLDTLKTLKEKSKMDFIDAGGFIGDSALKLAEYTTGSVHVFEPVSKNFDLMNKTIKMNHCKNIIPIKKGLGKENSSQLAYLSGSASSCKFQNNNFEQETVDITTLDSYVKKNNLQIGLIKTDVEGFEQDLLLGAKNTIKEQKPVLILSIYHTAEDFFYIKKIIEDLNLNYSFKIRKATYGQMLLETVLIAEVL